MIEHMIKKPPHSLEAEQGVIGGLLLGADFVDVSSVVNSVDFYMPRHQLVYSAVGKLFANGRSVDIITVSEYLQSKNDLENAGGLAYLAELANNTAGISNVVAYARVVSDRAVQRRLLVAAQEIAGNVFNGEGDTDQKIAHAQSLIMSVDNVAKEADVKTIQDITKGIIADLDNDQPADPGFKTGFADIDHLLTGLERGCVHVLAARPSTGKTLLALNIAENMAAAELSVLIFSLEMTAKSLGRRLVSSIGRIPNNSIRLKQMDDHWDKLSSAVHRIKNMRIFVNESSGIGIERIKSIARFQKKVNKIDVIFIDYLQLIKREKSTKSTTDEVGFISNEIKNMAKELDVAVVLLSQLNRGIENRSDKLPSMSDLRSSGDIEQDAETIVFMYRPPMSEDGITTITVAKNRDGELGQCLLALNGKHSRFEPVTGMGRPEPSGKKSWADNY